jgi:hypothetical protein
MSLELNTVYNDVNNTDTQKYKYYNRSTVSWDIDESEQLKKEYIRDNLDILECGIKHKRTPGCIAAKLNSMKLITHRNQARGYAEYIKSDLFTDIITSYGDRKKEREERRKSEREEKLEKRKLKIEITEPSQIDKSLSELRRDIDNLKKDVKEILRLINCIYDFETTD